MNDLVPLHFEQADVRMVMLEGVPWWVLADVAPLMGLRNPSKLAGRLEDYQKDAIPVRDTIGRWQTAIIVNEAGIYQLLGTSPKPAAKQFMRWLFTEVLPSIRMWGQYPPPQFALEDPDREQDRRTTPLQRLMSECDRVAPKHGMTGDRLLANMLSKGEKSQLKQQSLNVLAMLHRDNRWQDCDAHGMDLRYIMTGVWNLTPQERQIAAKMRAIQDVHRLERPPPQASITCEP